MSRLAEAHPSVLVCTVDIDELADLAGDLAISSIPRVQVFKSGALVEDYTGSSEDDLTALFARVA